MDVTRQNLHYLRCDRPTDRGRCGVVRISARIGQQVFLSGGFAFHGKWSVAAGDDGQKDATAAVVSEISSVGEISTRF